MAMLFQSKRSLTRQRRHSRKRLSFESLESRRLLTVGPWTNPLNSLDATGDGDVTARDALVIINQILRDQTADMGAVAPPILGPSAIGASFHFDTTGDRHITALDALRVINRLARDKMMAEESQEADGTAGPAATTAATDLALSDGFARTSGVLSSAEQQDVFRFVANAAHVAIDLSSIAGESKAEISVLDEFGVEVTRASQLGERASFEGIKLPTTTGRTYQIMVEMMPTGESSRQSAVEPFSYTLDVLEFDLQQWPGVTISNVHGYEWINFFGPGSELGDDIHGDDSVEATLARPFDRKIQFQSHLDTGDDVDWFRVPAGSNAVTISVRGQDGRVEFDVYDTALDALEPVTSISSESHVTTGTYLVDESSQLLVRVRSPVSFVGPYAFNLSDRGFTPSQSRSTTSLTLDDIVGDRLDDAADVTVGGRTIEIEQTLENSEDVDFFRIPIVLPATVVAMGLHGIRVELFDSAGIPIEQVDPIIVTKRGLDIDSYGYLPSRDSAGDFVYLRVASDSGEVGRYFVTIAFDSETSAATADDEPFNLIQVSDRPDSGFGDDPHGNDVDSSTPYSNDDRDTLTSFIDAPGDMDVFQLRGISGAVSMSVHSVDVSGITLTALDYEGKKIAPLWTQIENGAFGFDIDMSTVPEFTDRNGIRQRQLYIQVSSADESTGAYKLIRGIKRRSQLATQDIMGLDRHAGTAEHATAFESSYPSYEFDSFLDYPEDQDAFRFTAELSQLSLKVNRSEPLALRGEGSFYLYDDHGDLVDPTSEYEAPFKFFVSGFVNKTYDLEVGSQYVVVVSNEAENAFGRYTLFFEPIGDIVSTLDLRSVVDVPFTAAAPLEVGGQRREATIAGEIGQLDELDLYRFSTSGTVVQAKMKSEGSQLLQLFDLGTGLPVKPSFGELLAPLQSIKDNVTRDYLLAVWKPGTTGEYALDIEIIERYVAEDDVVGNTIEGAASIDMSTLLGESNALYVQLNSTNDVDVYSFEAVGETTTVAFFGSILTDFAVENVDLQLLDSRGNPIAGQETSVLIGDSLSLMGFGFGTEFGETYFLRFTQTTPNPLSVRVLFPDTMSSVQTSVRLFNGL